MEQLPSNAGTISWGDILRGFLIAAGGSIIGGLITTLSNGGFPKKEQLIVIASAALSAGLIYVLKNLGNTVPAAQKTIAAAEAKKYSK